jgi:hypothetical protein
MCRPCGFSIMEWNFFCCSWFNCIIEKFVSNVCFKSFGPISISCDCSLMQLWWEVLFQVFYDAGQDMDGLPIFLEKVGFVFLLPKGFHVHISLGTFVFFLNYVQVHKCGIHVHSFSTNWIWRVNQSLFKNTHFVIIY